jgi:hypothetical protein
VLFANYPPLKVLLDCSGQTVKLSRGSLLPDFS